MPSRFVMRAADSRPYIFISNVGADSIRPKEPVSNVGADSIRPLPQKLK